MPIFPKLQSYLLLQGTRSISMKEKLIEILVCPTSKSSLKLVVEKREGDDVIEGALV